MKLRNLAFLLALSACAQEPVYAPVAADIPVGVPCKTPPVTHPAWPFTSATDQTPFYDRVKLLLTEIELRKAFEAELAAAAHACN